MTEEELNMQRENRDYIKESQDFLNETVSITAQLSDQIQFQVNSVREKMNLDNDVLKISRENYKSIANLKTDYQDLKTLSSDREKIERQIQKNLTIAGAYSQKLQKGEKEAAKSYLLKEASLKSQQDTLAQMISKAEALEDAIKIDEALGRNTDELYKQLIAQEEQKTLYQGYIGDLTSIINKEQQKLSPQAISVALLEEQNDLMEDAIDYLNEEEEAINRMTKAQSYFNATFGALGGLLDTLGMGSVTEALGIKEGGKAAAEMADKLTEGGQKSLGVFGKLKVLAAGMGPMFKKIFNPLTIGMGIFNFMVKKFKEGDELLKSLSAHTKTLAKGLGMSTASAKHLEHEFASIAGKTGQMPEAIAETTSKMMNLVGTTKNFGKEQVSFFNQLVENGGYSVENATELLKISEMQGKSTKELTSDYTTQVLALNNQRDSSVSVKSVMEGIANTSARVRANLRDQGKNLATAAFEAKRMGLELDRVNEIGKSSLDFESSLTKELEAELMLGKDLNLEKMRAAALRGDDVTVAEELNRLIRENGDDLKGNILGQEAFADAVGISVDEYANIREQQELLKSGGFKDMNEAQEHYNKLIESGMSIEEAKAKMGNDALGDQLASVSYAQRLEQQERRKQAEAAKFAKSMQPLVKMFREIAEKWSKLLLDNVGKLVPVVNAVGKLFSTIVLKVIGGASDMSATIGDKIEGISKFLVGIIDQGTSWVADGGINRFFETVKDTAKSIWKAIQPIIGFFKSKTGKTVLAGMGGAIAIQEVGKAAGIDPLKMAKEVGGGVFNTLKVKLFPKLGVLGSSASNPMFVQDIGGGGGEMQDQIMDMVGKVGGRKAGIGGGFKKGFKGLIDYTKMAFKGGRAGKVGRARLLRAAGGLIKGQGASFVGGTSKAASGASKVASGASKVANVASKVGKLASVGKLAAGGLGAVAGIAAEAAFKHFAGKAREAASALGDQIYASEDATEIAGLEAKQKKKLMQADALGAAGTVAKYTALGASIGSVIPGVGTAVGAIVGFAAGAAAATINFKRDQEFRSTQAYKDQEMRQRRAAQMQKNEEKIGMMGAQMRMDAEMKAAKLTLAMTEKFGDTSNMTGERLKELAAESLAAGNITKDQYTEAIKGTISPLDLLNISTQNASDALTQAAEASIALANAAGDEAKAKSLAAAGTSEAMIDAQMNVINMAGDNVGSIAADLASKYGDSLSGGVMKGRGDIQARELLRGEGGAGADAAAEGIKMALQEQLGGAATAEQIEAAMRSVGDTIAGSSDKALRKLDINDAAGLETVLSMVVAEIGTKTQDVLKNAEKEGQQALIKGLSDAKEKDAAAELMAELVDVSKNAAAAVAAAEKDGASAGELQELQTAAASALSAIEVAAKEEAEAARFRSVELGGGGETKAKVPTLDAPTPEMTNFEKFKTILNPKETIKNFKLALDKYIPKIKIKFSSIIDKIKIKFSSIIDKIKIKFSSIIDKIKNKFKSSVENIKEFFTDIPTTIKEKFNSTIEGIKEKFSNTFTSIKEKIAEKFSDFKEFFTLGNLQEKFTEAFTKVKNKVKEIFSSIGETISNKFKSPINAIIGMINSLITSINKNLSITPPEWTGVDTIGINIPTIPLLAEGGIVNSATLAVIGEAGPEAIIPLDKLSSEIPPTTPPAPAEPSMLGSLFSQISSKLGEAVPKVSTPIEGIPPSSSEPSMLGSLFSQISSKLGEAVPKVPAPLEGMESASLKETSVEPPSSSEPSMLGSLFSQISSKLGEAVPKVPTPIEGAESIFDFFKTKLGEIPEVPTPLEGAGAIFDLFKTKLEEVGPQISTSLDKLSSSIPLDNSNSRVSNEPLPQSNDELKKELQELKEIMSGFVKQMAQVVDRPITVELDGNKVGQALGQNSYRMQ